jgi:hypothetical protein
MKNNVSMKSIFKPIAEVFRRYHVTIFIVVIVSGLATSVMLLNNILQSSTNISGYSQNGTSTSFDQATIDQLDQLHTSADNTQTIDTSKGRISPFSE